MNIAQFSSLEIQKLKILLKAQYKFDFILENPAIGSRFRLNYLIRNKASLNKEDTLLLAKYQNGFETSSENALIKKIETGTAITNNEMRVIAALVPRLDKIKIKSKPENYTLEEDEPLTKVLAFYQDILTRYESGEAFTWEKPWNSNMVFGHPVNLDGRYYQGQNVEHLSVVQQLNGFSVPVWLTRKNLETLGVEDIHAIPASGSVMFASSLYRHKTDRSLKLISRTDFDALTDDEQKNYQLIVIRNEYPVWHPDTLEPNLSDDSKKMLWSKSHYFALSKRLSDDEQYAKRFYSEQAEQAIVALCEAATKMGVDIVSHKNGCFYRPVADVISMVPRQQFTSVVAYAGTLAHELIHATGHESRLKRIGVAGRVAEEESTSSSRAHIYGFEELVAETGANNFLLRFNLPSTLDKESAAYIVGWLKALSGSKQKKYGLFDSAVKQGDQAASFLESHSKTKPLPITDIDVDETTDLECCTLLMLNRLHEWKTLYADKRFDEALLVKQEIQQQYESIQKELSSSPAVNEVTVARLTKLMDCEFDEMRRLESIEQVKPLQKVAKTKLRLRGP